jgi:hypothetical protein
MTDIDPSTSTASSARHATAGFPAEAEGPVTAWVGWIFFAALIMIMVGIFQLIEGLVGIFNRGYYQVAETGLVVHVGYGTWGWVQLIVGLVTIAAGFGVMVGNMAARVVGIILAVLSAVVHLAFIGAAPVWSTIVITIDVLVIYALAVHGRELRMS